LPEERARTSSTDIDGTHIHIGLFDVNGFSISKLSAGGADGRDRGIGIITKRK